MDEQTESATPFMDRLYRDEPTFVLRAQDITADLVVDFWIKVQQKVRTHMDAGLTMTEAVKAVRAYYFLEPGVSQDDRKLWGASIIALNMQDWPNRKVAD